VRALITASYAEDSALGLLHPGAARRLLNCCVMCRSRTLEIGDVGAENLRRFDHDLWDKIGHGLKVGAKLQKIAGLEWLLNFTIRRAAHSQEVRDKHRQNSLDGELLQSADQRRAGAGLCGLRPSLGW
jgi:hypothetical protein